ncbi:type VII secretion system (Wss) protein ESAT-6 [Nocardia mexicana]|uniref:Type VII secretion system (Wss) protein ESAT-6 n=2 Tax=Nocardia mexicana TaxID=279262 RepID=A0A370H9M6_9NOCA|nr:type VII secretion system (Wss) protein ESAT-6 [Nocardia mexicana]
MHRMTGNAPGTGTPDPDYAPTVEVFDQMRYDEIYRGVLQLNPEVLTAGRQAWQGAATGLGDAVQQAHAEIRGAVADGWRGGAAQQAVAAMQAFEELGQHVADVMSDVARRLGQANDAAETLRATVAKPVSAGPDLQAALLDPKRATLNVAVQKQAEGLRQDVVRVMDTVYAGAFVPTGNGVPAFYDGGMYPTAQPPAPVPGDDGGGPNSTDSAAGLRAATAPGPVVEPVRPQAAAEPQASRPEPVVGDPVASGAVPGAAAATAPAAATVPAGTGTAAPEIDRPAAAGAAAPVSAVASQSDSVVAAPVGTASGPVPTRPAATATTAQSSDDQRKREEHEQRRDPATDTVSGMGAGVVGGLAGGAFAAGDAVRSGAGIPLPPKRSRDDDEYDEDDEFYADFDEPTYLEPAEPGTELVGQLDPTTPPVLGEWAEDD